jgi:hypothetical protein
MIWIVVSLVCYGCWYLYNKESNKIFQNNPSLKSKPVSELDSYELNKIKVDNSNKRLFGGIAIAALLYGGYQSFVVPANNARDVETQREAFMQGYSEGWYFECDNIFNNSVGPGGVLYAGSNQYSESWCQGLLSSASEQSAYDRAGSALMAEFSSDESEKRKGTGYGATDAIKTVFSYTEYLCYGTECTTEFDEEMALESLAEPYE